MNPPLIILSPARSFSSVISTMLGEHPDLYGFPELHLFVGDTVQEVMDYEYRKHKRYTGPPGVVRSLAELHDGMQTTGSVVRAVAWLSERRDWSTQKLMNYMLEQIEPRIGVEKSPVTCLKMKSLERAYAFYPSAFYLHLTRHPVSTRKSWMEFSQQKKSRRGDGQPIRVDRLMAWYHMHSNILAFTNRLPLGQAMRIRGEDVLSDPDLWLPQIAEWLGIRTDLAAIDAMKHPESSPYACFGPEPARGGNDPKFMRSPALRIGRIPEPSLAQFLDQGECEWFPELFRQAFEESSLAMASDGEIEHEITELAGAMGYR